MKKLIALLAVLMLLLSACGEKPEPTAPETTAPTVTEPPATEPAPTDPPSKFNAAHCEPLFGKWLTTITLDGSLINMKGLEGSFTYDVLYLFTNKGDYQIGTNEELFKTAISDYETAIFNFMMNGFYTKFIAECKLEGMGKTEREEAWENSKKAESEEKAQSFITGLDLTNRLSGMFRQGDYYVENGRVYLSLDENAYESSLFTTGEGVLTLSRCDNAAAYQPLKLNEPLTLTPVTR